MSEPLHSSHSVRPKYENMVERVSTALLGTIILTELVVLFGSIVLRALFGISFHWAEEIAGMALVALTFIGGAIAYRRGEHMSVRVLVDKIPERWHPVVEALEKWLILIMAIVICVLFVSIFKGSWDARTSVLALRKSWNYIPLALGMIFFMFIAVERLVRLPRKTSVLTGVAVLALLLVWATMVELTGPWDGYGGLLFLIFVLSTIVAIGVPIGFALTIVSLMHVHSSQVSILQVVPSAMQAGVGSFVMLAIPFFILAGFIMTEGGLTRPLANWAASLVGHLRGGLLQAVIVCIFIFSGISGSKIADVAAIGTTMKDMLEKEGYEPAETAAVLDAAAVMGETIPPSLPMLVLGSITTISVGALFLAGVIPALVMAICLMLLIYVRARKFEWKPGRRASWGERGKATILALPALVVPFLLVAGIAGGLATPTEVSSIAVIYGLFLSATLYRGCMDLRCFTKVLTDGGAISGMILFIIASGSAFSWVMTAANVPHDLAAFITSLGESNAVFMVGTIIALWIMGSLLEGLPAILIFAPMLIPIAAQLGIDPLQYGIVLIFAMGLGAFSPPIGVGFFVSCAVVGASVEQTSSRVWPYLLVLFTGLLLVAFVPWFSLVLPRMLLK